MIELDPVGEHRVFVPTSGDWVKVCPECGNRAGILDDAAHCDPEAWEIISTMTTGCCDVVPELRQVP